LKGDKKMKERVMCMAGELGFNIEQNVCHVYLIKDENRRHYKGYTKAYMFLYRRLKAIK